MGQTVSSSSVDWNYIAPPIVQSASNIDESDNSIIEGELINDGISFTNNYTEKKETLNTMLTLLEHAINNSFYNKNFNNKNEIIIQQLDTTINEIDQKKNLNDSKFHSNKELFINNLNENKSIEQTNMKLKLTALVLILVALFMKVAI